MSISKNWLSKKLKTFHDLRSFKGYGGYYTHPNDQLSKEEVDDTQHEQEYQIKETIKNLKSKDCEILAIIFYHRESTQKPNTTELWWTFWTDEKIDPPKD